MRMNIVSIIEGSSLLGKTPATKQEIELREKDKKKPLKNYGKRLKIL